MVLFAVMGMAVVLLVTPLLLRLSQRGGAALGRQDLHHTHSPPVPRIGGAALSIAFVLIELTLALFFPERRASTPGRNVLVAGALAIFALGFWDDLRPLGAKRKLLGQILIAVLVHHFGVGISSFKLPFTEQMIYFGNWSIFVTVIWLVAMTNLINLIDGVDGLAGGICLMLMILIAYLGHASGSYEIVACGMAGALMGFLWFNFPPAKIYMGDGGAYFLGFLVGGFTILNSQKGTILAALVAPLFVLALPILDTSFAIIRRGIHGLPVFRPDRRHLHHRLLELGLTRRQVVLSLYGVTLVLLVLGFAAFMTRAQFVPVIMGVAVLVLLLLAGRVSFSR
jgi:UDP-GlcNAc:undecaprenyl-phosphate GlcNAc-1-phosphate transferase